MIVYEERTHSAPSYRIKLSQATLTDLKALAYAVEAAESGITDELFGDNGVSFTSRPVGSTVFGVFRNAPGQDEMEVVRVPLDRGE